MNQISELLTTISNCIDPTTGEVFDESLFKDPDVRDIIVKLLSMSGIKMVKSEPLNPFNRPANLILDELKKWRRGVAGQLGIPSYYIFNDNELDNIANSDVVEKEDLLRVKGFGPKKYSLYGKEVYAILKPYIENDENRN